MKTIIESVDSAINTVLADGVNNVDKQRGERIVSILNAIKMDLQRVQRQGMLNDLFSPQDTDGQESLAYAFMIISHKVMDQD